MGCVDMEDYIQACKRVWERFGKDTDIEIIIKRAEEVEQSYERMEHRYMKLQMELLRRGVDLDTVNFEEEGNKMNKKTEERKKYIAYGSNLNLEQMAVRCPTAKVVGTGMIKDHELLFRGSRWSAVATVEPKEGTSVPVLVWDIGPEDEKYLDVYEGFPRLYGKEMLEVETENGIESIMAYTMNAGRPIGAPSSHYYNVIEQGYIDAGFDVNYLQERAENCLKLCEEMKNDGNGEAVVCQMQLS